MPPLKRSLTFAHQVTETEEWIIYPREHEGNRHDVNWSLVGDGVVPPENAFLNARLAILQQLLPVKVLNNKVELKTPLYNGEYKFSEAGNTIGHEDFTKLQKAAQNALSSQSNLFVEDGTLGTAAPIALGVRVVTDNAAMALISRSLLVSESLPFILLYPNH